MALYDYRKELDIEVERLTDLLMDLDEKEDLVQKFEKRFREDTILDKVSETKFKDILSILKGVKAKGRTPRPDRQIGAWQSFEVSAYSKVNQALQVSSARTVPISDQERKLIGEARLLIDEFEKEVKQFERDDWSDFMKFLEN